jgi:hypothetical protein
LIVDSISVQNDAENICTKLANLKSVRRTSGDPPGKFLGIFGRNDLVGKYQKRLEDLEENVRMEQSDTTRSRQVHISTNFGLAQTMMFQYLPICLLYCIGISIWLWCSSFRKFIYKHFNILSSVLIFFTSL